MSTAPAITENAAFVFESARDAIDAVSAFEASTLGEWEYRIEACERDDAMHYRVGLNNLATFERAFLEPAR